MDNKFLIAINVVLKHEGGYVNHPNDPGGETNFGITKRTYPHLDIKNLTKEDAKGIYYLDWWKRYRYEEIDDVRVATKVFDTAINTGASPAHRMLQRALHACDKRHVTEDGVLGPQTFTAVNESNPDWVLVALQAEQASYYRRLIERNGSLGVFRAGWMNRAYKILSTEYETTVKNPVKKKEHLTKSFVDVKDDHWAFDAIMYLADRSIFTGRVPDYFEPALPVSRAELANSLHRLLNHLDRLDLDKEDSAWNG